MISVIPTNRIYFFNKILVFYPIFNSKNALSSLFQFWSLKMWFFKLWTNFEFPGLWSYHFTFYALKCKNNKLMIAKWGVNNCYHLITSCHNIFTIAYKKKIFSINRLFSQKIGLKSYIFCCCIQQDTTQSLFTESQDKFTCLYIRRYTLTQQFDMIHQIYTLNKTIRYDLKNTHIYHR